MAHYGLLGGYQLHENAEDIRGAALYGHDEDGAEEKLGKIDDVIFDHATGDISYVVVDTGGWLRTKQFILPATRLRSSPKHKHDFGCDLTKKQVESFPAYNERELDSEDKWKDYEDRYRSQWESGPVMHREGTDRNITPTTQQLQGNRSSLQAAGETAPMSAGSGLDRESLDVARSDTGRIIPAGADAVVISNSAVGIGGRWDTFQARLRERRKEAVASCTTCTVGSASTRDPLRKAV
jgi:PRC-barrel domain